ncbi:MAG TPA: hypothetical protein VNR00_08185 [Opitutus sp.]|nr:hypothetical protein [Opitutus sp.]
MQRHDVTPRADCIAERSPFAAGAFQQTYFVFGKEDEIAVRICAETAFGCRRAEASERRQSSLVIVLKSGSLVRARERAPADAGELSGEGIVHGSAMAAPSAAHEALAKDFC